MFRLVYGGYFVWFGCAYQCPHSFFLENLDRGSGGKFTDFKPRIIDDDTKDDDIGGGQQQQQY